MSENIQNPPCPEWEPLIALLAAGEEFDSAEGARLAEHLARCAACSEALEHEKELLALLAEHRNEPDAALLASCRASLEDALDREEERGWLGRRLGALLPLNGLELRPAWSAALLLMAGFSVGILGPRVLLRHSPVSAAPQISSASSIAAPSAPTPNAASAAAPAPANTAAPDQSASSSLAAMNLHAADVAGISVLPSDVGEPQRVELRFGAPQPVTIQGTVEDDGVRNALLYVLRNNERFCPEMRFDAASLLRARANDPDVRSVLCRAVHLDRDAAVRLKALEALNGSEPQDMVTQTLLDALVDDQSPGVRIEAVNALRDLAARSQAISDDRMLSVLRDRMQNDPNAYIRLQSAAMVRDLGPRQKF